MKRNDIGHYVLIALLITVSIAIVVTAAVLIISKLNPHGLDREGESTDTEPAATDAPDTQKVNPPESDNTDSTTPSGSNSDNDTEPQSSDTTADTDKEPDETNTVTVTKYDEPAVMYALYNVNARMSYTVDSDIYGMIYQSETVSVTGETDNGWYQVKYRGYTAYIRSDLLTIDSGEAAVEIEELESPVTMYAKSEVNVRESYSTNSKILKTLAHGDAVTVTAKTGNGWYAVKFNDGTADITAYIKNDYLSETEPAPETVPPETEPPRE